MSNGGWSTEKNVKRYLQHRPSVKEMKVLLQPMSYLHTYDPGIYKSKPRTGCVPAHGMKHVDMEATKKAHDYEKQLSRQLLKDLMTQKGIPYDKTEAKMQSLYSRHGKYAVVLSYNDISIQKYKAMLWNSVKDILELTGHDIITIEQDLILNKSNNTTQNPSNIQFLR